MDWIRVRDRLEEYFSVPKLEIPEGKIWILPERVGFGAVVAEAAQTEEEKEVIEEEGIDGILAKQWPPQVLLEFEWESLGPMSWFVDLAMLDVGSPRIFLYAYVEALAEAGEDPRVLIAALQPKANRVLFESFFRGLMRGEYGIDLFGDLPSTTTNHRPALMPADSIGRGYWEWMERAARKNPAVWTDPRDRGLRKAIDPRLLRPLGEQLAEGLDRRRRTAQRDEEGATLAEDERRRVFEIYFSQAYRERSK